MGNIKELLTLAETQVGYQEKASQSWLDDFNKNAGYGNYTKYSRDVDAWGLQGCQGQPWCATYQFWLEAKTFGIDQALEHFYMSRKSYTAYNCLSIWQAFKTAGKISEIPETGCLVIFRQGQHIGRVTGIGDGRIQTNEGNTSARYGDINGGTVKNKSYLLTDSGITGYCLIDYGQEQGDNAQKNNIVSDSSGLHSMDNSVAAEKYLNSVKEYQSWLNTWYGSFLLKQTGEILEADGFFGKNTVRASLLVWKDILNRLYGCRLELSGTVFDASCRSASGKAMIRSGDKGTLVMLAEGILSAKEYYKGEMDACFGCGMEEAVKKFQKTYVLEADGVIGQKTWTQFFKCLEK